jgi:peptidoglycan/xylan/chitin deacetylase (PgdA/CDA1 family)
MSTGRRVLVFHRVLPAPLGRDHDLAWPDFLMLINRLVAAGITFTTDLAGAPRDGAVVLTFDDATTDHRDVGQELADRGVPAVFFVPAGLLGLPGQCRAAEIRSLAEEGHVIASHGWSHQRLDLLPESDLPREIESSREKLEDVVGIPVTLFAPPGGIGVESLPERLAAAGYVASRSVRWGIHEPNSDRWQIPTIPVTQVTADRGWVVKAATEGRLPPVMLALRSVRDTLSPDARTRLRHLLHRRHGTAASRPL